MKKFFALLCFAFVSVVLIDRAGAQQPARSLFFPSNRLPPPNGMYLAPAQSSVATANGIIISNLVHRGFTLGMPAPPTGTSATFTSDSQIEFDLSVNGGGTFTRVSLPAAVLISLQGRPVSGGQQTYDTEMLQLQISGNLPGGVRIRESPSRASAGQAAIQSAAGGYRVSSFFDIFFDVSLDGGQNWVPVNPAQHVELRVDPLTIASVPEPSPLWPPPDDQLRASPEQIATFTGGVRIKGLRQTIFSQAIDASLLGAGLASVTLPFTSTADLQVSLNNGQTYTEWRGPVTLSVMFQKVRGSPTHLFDTEMLQLDISGNLPGGLMIRESPTLPSYGGAMIREMADGTFEAGSFFDVWVELSADGGQTWQTPSTGPWHLEMQGNSPRDNFASSNLPTPGGQYAFLIGLLRSYQTGGNGHVLIGGGTLTGFSSSSPPPGVGQTLNQNFNAQANLKMSFDDGLSFTSVTATASARIQVRRSNINWGNTAFYDTEMLQLDITGLPQGAMLRESPTLASPGRTSIRSNPTGGYRLDSFFDVFTELSVDGGQSWHAAVEGAISHGLVPVPTEAPLKIGCPSDITGFATSASGAVVTFSPGVVPGECPIGIPTSTCTPPSGSVFPIGTTTVTCEAHNGCGEHMSCTFHVIVLPSLSQVVDHFFPRGLWPPLNGIYLSPAPFGSVSAGGIIFSNFAFRSFSRNSAPPLPGASLTLSVPLNVELDWSLNGGGTFTHGSAPAKLTINLQNIGPGQISGQEVHQMEVLRMEISGGNLPGGLMIRESPTRPSTGQTGVTPAGGGFMVGSFFDIFFEVSTDGGQTWSPSDHPAHLELRVDPDGMNPVPEFSPLSPPPDDQFVSPSEFMTTFTSVRLKNLRHSLFSQAFDATLLGVSSVPAVQRFNAMADLQWSLDGGQTFTGGRAPVLIGLLIHKIREAAIHVFDTEMIQLDLSGGDLPAGLRIRESPTMPSHGEMALEPLADGTFRVSSFFDVWLEASADGGQTWQPAQNGPMHLEHQGKSVRSRFASSLLPPSGGQYRWPPGAQQSYHIGANNIVLISGNQRNFSETFPPPQPGQTTFETYNSQMDLRLSLDGGQTFNPYTASALAQVQVSGNAGINWGDAQFYVTEMLRLDISGGTLPPGLMIRESPSRASLGRTSLKPDPGNGFRLDSFFDVFTELSLDGGQTWNSAIEGPVSSALNPTPSFAPYVITCPSNITVLATSSSGAVVNYTLPPITFFPDCPFCCFSATCTPPSGSLFPIGTTTVNCVGHDGCGESPTCSFTITVIQPFIYGGLVDSVLGSAVLKTFHSGTGAPASLIISNLGLSGADGFHVNLGLRLGGAYGSESAADSLRLNFQPFPATDFTDIVSTATGPYGLDPDHVLGVSVFSGGANPLVRADFSSIGSALVGLQIRDQDHHLVSSSIMANNQWLDINSIFPPPCTNVNTTVYTYWQGPDYAWYRFCKFGCNCLGTNCYTERIVCFRALAPFPVRPASLSGLDMRLRGAAVPASLTILSEDIGKFGNLHEAKGNAAFELETGLLAVNNIGFSGEDGVAVNLNNVRKFDMILAPTRLLAQGACLNIRAAGDVNGLPAVQIGGVSLANAGGTLQVNGNFTGLGATTVRAEIYLNSEFQGGITLPAGALGTLTITGNLIGCGTLAQPLGGVWASFDSSFLFTSANNQSFTGNQIRILPANPTAQARSLSQFCVQGCNLGQIAILDESVPPSLGTPARLGDGSVHVSGQGVAGAVYRLEAAADLGPQNSWRTVNSAEADIDGSFELSDPNTKNPPQQFYRAVTP